MINDSNQDDLFSFGNLKFGSEGNTNTNNNYNNNPINKDNESSPSDKDSVKKNDAEKNTSSLSISIPHRQLSAVAHYKNILEESLNQMKLRKDKLD